MKFSIKDSFSKCEQICRNLQCHGWPTKKILGFRWFKIRLETISFWQNISISVLSFLHFCIQWKLAMKSYQFLEIYIRFDKKEKKHSYNSQLEKKN